jgi:deoxyribonuclease II
MVVHAAILSPLSPQVSMHTVVEADSALALTLEQMYDAARTNTTKAYLQYNDQPPGSYSHDGYGHTKGVMTFENASGFWLIHSVPLFPTAASTGKYSYDDGSKDYGQSFFCLSLDRSNIEKVAGQLLYMKPAVYESNLPDGIASSFPVFESVIDRKWHYDAASNKEKLHTLGGQVVTQFAKTSKWGKDLYSDFIGPEFGTDLYVETWMNGINPMPTYCVPEHDYNTRNIRALDIGGVLGWPETKDHSKWATSVPASATSSTLRGASSKTKASGTNIACIGGINRQMSQMGRAGGSACIESKELADAFRSLVAEVDDC